MTRHTLPSASPIPRASQSLSPWFDRSLVGVAVAGALSLLGGNASALTLGRLNIQSALGEPLRAEIEVTEATAEEIFGLKVNIASTDAFRAAGVPFNPVLSDMRANLQRRADGRYVVRLTSNRALGEPFVDLLLEASWNSGRIVRDYTVLLDPPAARSSAAAAPIAPTAPQTSAPSQRPPILLGQAARPRAIPQPAPDTPAPATASAPAPAVAGGAARGSGDQQVAVRPGDTASKIAGAYKPADVSLEQMLVAMLRANPSAFVGGNVNRLKAGAVLDLPAAGQAASVPPAEARQTVTAQSRDFGAYRRRLADNAPVSRVAEADRRASGRLQANVEDRNAATASADKLRLSQSLASGAQSEEQLAKAREARDAGTRVAELSKNINDLNRLQGNSGAAATSPSTPAPSSSPSIPAAPAAPANTPSSATPPAVPTTSGMASSAAPSPSASTSAGTSTPAAVPGSSTAGAPSSSAGTGATAAPAAAASPAAAPATATPALPGSTPVATAAAAPESRGFLAELMDNPLILAGAALIALLVGFLLYRVLGKKKVDAGDSVFLESRMPKDSFFGATGGESVDTKERGNSVMSSLSYSPSQLDAGDVDPVAEADVYLAYGRDLQAEEILREALRVNPDRTAIHLKLLEIHVKRRDLRAFEATALEVQKLSGGSGPDWERAVELGKELDPANPLYDKGATTVSQAEAAAFAGTLAAATADPAPVTVPVPLPSLPEVDRPAFVPTVAPLDFDLDLSEPSNRAPLHGEAANAATAPFPESASAFRSLDESDFDSLIASEPPVSPPVMPAAMPAATTPATTSEQPPAPFADEVTIPFLPAADTKPAPLPFSPTLALDLDQDFDTAPGALEEPTARAPLMANDDFTQPATLRAGLPGDSGFIEFDMSSLGGLGDRGQANTEPGRLENLGEPVDSPHAIKLSLARELKELGDIEGARSLVEEVAAESSGEVNVEAKQLLGQLR
ncbi:Pilus assembly protein FimV [Burkholderiales bacterium 8X]|nr:Pilus assembly protein FimV [Burkholderiales bacterium 8X]